VRFKPARRRADTAGVRVPLSYKLVLQSLLVAATVVSFPHFLAAAGLSAAFWVAPFVALGVGGGLGFFLSRELGGRFDAVRSVTDRIRTGDLRQAPLPAPSRFLDETDDISRSVHEMLESLRDVVEQVQQIAGRVSNAAADLSRSTRQTHSTNEEASVAVEGLAKGVSNQQELLDGAMRTIRDIAQTIELNASRAREAFGFSAEASQKAHAGVDVSRLALEKMKTVFQRVEQAGGLVFQLEAKTRHVHQITEMIHSVAQRTNLLSLNASIEAARAGEAGRGFSVVADEIRKLAESSGRSAEEISKLMHEIQAETAEVADEMRQSSMVIGEGRDDVNTIAHSLEQIQSAVQEAAARAEEIFQEADAQARDAERMVGSMDEIGRVSVANASAIREVSEATECQVGAVKETVSSAQVVTELADEMRRVLRRFRTDDGSRPSGDAHDTDDERFRSAT
jgi:methyl-accepting chemotaxis protein